mmetsp:Transcript_19446/g.60042  ORF Transcript_19446/g.60042 Transcript_19446/m.60042 type:complete len:235 (+) Transcript_19446:1224-1928(+)
MGGTKEASSPPGKETDELAAAFVGLRGVGPFGFLAPAVVEVEEDVGEEGDALAGVEGHFHGPEREGVRELLPLGDVLAPGGVQLDAAVVAAVVVAQLSHGVGDAAQVRRAVLVVDLLPHEVLVHAPRLLRVRHLLLHLGHHRRDRLVQRRPRLRRRQHPLLRRRQHRVVGAPADESRRRRLHRDRQRRRIRGVVRRFCKRRKNRGLVDDARRGRRRRRLALRRRERGVLDDSST